MGSVLGCSAHRVRQAANTSLALAWMSCNRTAHTAARHPVLQALQDQLARYGHASSFAPRNPVAARLVTRFSNHLSHASTTIAQGLGHVCYSTVY